MVAERFHLRARFAHADTGKPLSGSDFRVRFYDADLLKNDYLGESALSDEGVADVTCKSSDFQAGLLGRFFARLAEQKPDIYCEIMEGDGPPIYRSAIRWNVPIPSPPDSAGPAIPEIDLGSYAFRRGEGVADPGYYAGIRRPVF